MRDVGPLINKSARRYKALAILILNTLVIFLCLELLSVGASKIRTIITFIASKPQDRREESSYYTSKSWAPQYWKEMALTRKQQYHAFTVWRRAAFKGETINIDARGVRLTPGSVCTADAFKVFAFGSSHMWGTGAPDWGTIPAYLQAGLRNYRDGPICVTNFGESGYVSTQSVIELILQLQAGNIPNVAIFFDGAADIYTGYQSGRADVHENFERTAALVEQPQLPKSPLLQLLESLSLFQLINSQVAKLTAGSPPAVKLVTYETMNIDGTSLTNGIVETYLSNYRTVSALAQRYGFEYYFFWPPHISSGRKSLTSEEEGLKLAVDPALQKLQDSVYQVMEARIKAEDPEYKNLFSVTDVFDDCRTLIWLDDAHTIPEGNQMIAERMWQVIRARHSLQG